MENWPSVTLVFNGKNSGSKSSSYSETKSDSKAPKRQAAIQAKEKITSQAEIEAEIIPYPVKKHKAKQIVGQAHQEQQMNEYDESNEYD